MFDDDVGQEDEDGESLDSEYAFQRWLEQQWDSALNRDGPLDGIRPIWDGPYQYFGGVVSMHASPEHLAHLVGLLDAAPVCEERMRTRRRAIKRLFGQAPELLPQEDRPFTKEWLAAAPRVLRDYLDGDRSLDIDDVTFHLLRKHFIKLGILNADAA